MVRICAHAFHAVQNQHAQTNHIRANAGLVVIHRRDRFLLQDVIHRCSGLELRRACGLLHVQRTLRHRRCILCLNTITHFRRLLNQVHKARRVEIHIGQGGKKTVLNERIHVFIRHAHAASQLRVLRNALDLVNQNILQIRSHCILTARAAFRSAASNSWGTLGLFTLIAQHNSLRKSQAVMALLLSCQKVG